MPKLEIAGNESDVGWIHAVANFPNDAKLRNYYDAINHAQRELAEFRKRGYVEIEIELLDALINAPSRDDMKLLVAANTRRGFVAGYFLLGIFVMHSFPKHISEPSQRKAIMLGQEFARRAKFGDGSLMPRAESTILKCFADFNSVAHLWAAMTLLGEMTGDIRKVFANDAAVRVYLRVARTLQDFGTSFSSQRVPKLARKPTPLLDPKRVWRIPGVAQELVLPWKDPPEWMLQAIKKYKARTTTY